MSLLALARVPRAAAPGEEAIEEPCDRMLLADEVAAILRVPVARIYELVRTGRLPAVRVGRLVRIPESRLYSWIAAGGTEADHLEKVAGTVGQDKPSGVEHARTH